MVGITQNRSIQDEKLIEAVFQSHHSPETRASNGPVYGATTTNIIIDARPTTNAVANTAKGAGTENMDHYKEARKAYLGIDNIHVMRDSLNKVVEAIREAESMSATVRDDLNAEVKGLMFLDRQALRRSGWLRHISAILEGALLIVRNIHVNSSHVLIHCSDGWDRTAQLSSVAQLCLDPFYRTMRGFQILIEKDWLSFGHKFLDRCGHLSSDKFFLSPSEAAGGGDSAQSFLSVVQNRFASQQHLKETSPVFHQFLESVRQVQRQFPERFEFNERFLQRLHYHLYACQFGTFLFNCERERRISEAGPPFIEHTVSAWDFFNSPTELEKNLNPSYDRSLDDPTSRAPKADMGVLFPNPRDVRLWHELYGRTDEEMNGRITAQVETPELYGPVEKTEDEPLDLGPATPSKIPLPLTPSPSSSPLLGPTALATTVGAPRNISPARTGSSTRPASTPPGHQTYADVPLPSPSITLSRSPADSSSHLTHSTSSLNLSSGKPPELFSSSGVKSMWGKLSSNASAALSVVQDVYTGVAKDLKAQSSGGERELAEKPTDLRNSVGWVDDDFASSSRGAVPRHTLGQSSNPWASVRSRSSAPSLFDNPWTSSTSSSTPEYDSPTGGIFERGSLPPDPTVALPSRPPEIRRSSRSVSVAQPEGKVEGVTGEEMLGHVSTPSPSRTNTDPLGVGL
jgi:myotubularin-related protein 6/7/8